MPHGPGSEGAFLTVAELRPSAAVARGPSPDTAVRTTALAAVRTLAYFITCDASSIVDVFRAQPLGVQAGKGWSFTHDAGGSAEGERDLVRDADCARVARGHVVCHADRTVWAVR